MNNQGPSQEDLSAPLLHQQSNNTNMPRQQKLSPKSDDSSSASGKYIINWKYIFLCS